MTLPKGKKMIDLPLDESIHREIKIYSAETGQPMYMILKPITDELEQSCIKLVSSIREMKRKAELQRQKEEEEARISIEHPITVSGHEEDPLGTTIEPTTS